MRQVDDVTLSVDSSQQLRRRADVELTCQLC
jgi:hypothetical protein